MKPLDSQNLVDLDNSDNNNLFDILSKDELPSAIVEFPRRRKDGSKYPDLLLKQMNHGDQCKVHDLATAAVAREYKKLETPIDINAVSYQRRLENEIAKHFVQKICYLADRPNRLAFDTPEQVQQVLTNDDCAYLLKHYDTLCVSSGPAVYSPTQQNMEKWLEQIIKAGEQSEYFLDYLLPQANTQFVIYLANQLWNLRSVKHSVTEPIVSIDNVSKTE